MAALVRERSRILWRGNHVSTQPCLRRHLCVIAPSVTQPTLITTARCAATGTSFTSPPSDSPSASASAFTSTTQQWAKNLPEIPYGFPRRSSPPPPPPPLSSPSNTANATDATTGGGEGTSRVVRSPHVYAAEESGGLQRQWLQRLPHDVATAQVRVEHYVPNKDEFWQSPPYEALREIVLRTPYHDNLKIIMEHDYTFLFSDVMCNSEAPMPHVMYEDFMKVLTFCSRQRPPEEQFALPEEVLRDLLCWAAYYCTVDEFYFTSASQFFHKVEQEQHLSPALHAAWVYICTAAGKVEEALAYAVYMDQHDIPFDAAVFSMMLHPSLTPVQLHLHHAPHTSKGLVQQRRLCQDMQQHHGTAAVAVHAMFVYHMLTLRHTRKWEVLRSAAELQSRQLRADLPHHLRQKRNGKVVATAPLTTTAFSSSAAPVPKNALISARTMQLALSCFSQEKGIRWGPRTTKAMVTVMLADPAAGSTMADVLYVLLRVRRNERTAMLSELPRTAFSEAEQEDLMQAVYQRSRADPSCAVAAPLLSELLASGDSSRGNSGEGKSSTTAAQQDHDSDEGVLRALHNLQRLASSAAVSAVTPDNRTAQSLPSSSVDASAALPDEALYPKTASSEVDSSDVVSTAEVARDLLEALMALDRESVRRDAATSQTATTNATSKTDNGIMAAESPLETQLAAVQHSLTAVGASASLAQWSMQQAVEEAEEARLRAQVSTAWIAPSYKP